MKIQVLVTTMHATDFSKVEEMNLRDVDVIIANQTDRCAYEEQDFPDRNVHAVMVSTNTTGASLNRNIAMSYADGDILFFADDDMEFVDGFSDLAVNEFQEHPAADVIKFGCESTNRERPLSYRSPSEFCRASIRSLMSAGVSGMGIRRTGLQKYDIVFPDSIGPGRLYNCGEDSCFIKELLNSKLKVFLSPVLLAYVHQTESSWFTGYNEHFFNTIGYVYAKIYGSFAILFVLRRAFKMRNVSDNPLSFGQMVTRMRQGMAEFRK